jgi:hypothetical protein
MNVRIMGHQFYPYKYFKIIFKYLILNSKNVQTEIRKPYFPLICFSIVLRFCADVNTQQTQVVVVAKFLAKFRIRRIFAVRLYPKLT